MSNVAYRVIGHDVKEQSTHIVKPKVDKKTKTEELEEKYNHINKELIEIKKMLSILVSQTDDGK